MKKCNKCSAKLKEIVKLGYFDEGLGKTNEYIDNFISQLIICKTCFEKDKSKYWLRYKHIIKEARTKEEVTKNYLKICGHVGDDCITNLPKLCLNCTKIFSSKRYNGKQPSASPTDTHKSNKQINLDEVRQSTGTKAVIIGGGVILGIILIGVVYYISNKKKYAE